MRLLSREGDPPKKPPTQIKTVCTNSLGKLFCLFFMFVLKGKGDNLYKLSRNSLRKLFVQTVFIWVGVFWGGSSLHDSLLPRVAIQRYCLRPLEEARSSAMC